MKGVSFFICGTPSDSTGFEYITVGRNTLPGIPSQYLDRASDTRGSGPSTYVFKALPIDGASYTVYTEYRPLKPNDRTINRGAYIAVGFLASAPLTMDHVSLCVNKVSEIFGHLSTNIGTDNAFHRDFQLKKYHCHALLKELERTPSSPCSPVLFTDLIYQAMHNAGTFCQGGGELVLNQQDFAEQNNSDKYTFYTQGEADKIIRSLEHNQHQANQVLLNAENTLKDITQRYSLLKKEKDELDLCYASFLQQHRTLANAIEKFIDNNPISIDFPFKTPAQLNNKKTQSVKTNVQQQKKPKPNQANHNSIYKTIKTNQQPVNKKRFVDSDKWFFATVISLVVFLLFFMVSKISPFSIHSNTRYSSDQLTTEQQTDANNIEKLRAALDQPEQQQHNAINDNGTAQ